MKKTGDRDDRASACAGGIVLCGGLSRRMGEDKAELQLGGQSLLRRAVDLLSGVCDPVLLACGPHERYEEFGCALALDVTVDSGPVAGIIAGLEASTSAHSVVIACDMPLLSSAIIDALLTRARTDRLDVCFLTSERGLEPLCAVYGRRCLPALHSALAAGQRKVTAFLDEPHCHAGNEQGLRGLKSGRVHVDELGGSGGLSCLSNINTPEDIERARQREAEEQTP